MQNLELENFFHRKINLKNFQNFLLIFIFLLFFVSNQFPQQNQKQLVHAINKLISDPFFEQTIVALDIFDLTDSVSILQKNEKLLLRPASNMKLLTSAAALINLGKDFQFKTELFHTGIIEGDKLYGDLYVVGGFDPDFSTTDLDSFVNSINSLGIKELTGGIYGDISKKDSLYWGKGWMWDDDPDATAPYLSALNINNNAIKVFVEGSDIDSPAVVTTIPKTDFVKIKNNCLTVSADSSEDYFVTRDWVDKQNTILVEGKISKTSVIDTSERTTKLNLLYPDKYFLTLFSEKLVDNGINVNEPIRIETLPNNSVFLKSINRTIDSVLVDLNKESDNLNAEMLIYVMALSDSGAPATEENGLANIKKLIDTLGFDPDNFSIADGSGVSHYNLVSAELLNRLLRFMYYEREDLFDLFYESLPVAGVDGTLKNRMKNISAENNVHAKTGTLNGVSNLSGYVTAENGHLISFSILMQNFVKEYSVARNFQNRICELLAEYK